MIIYTLAFTDKGHSLLHSIFDNDDNFIIRERENEVEPLSNFVLEAFTKRLPVVFVGACGIAVRTIAPFVADKLLDSPVVVVDELGEFVIPVLSGHMGGANELAKLIAKKINATAVITTATDRNKIFSVDVFAKKNGLTIVNRDGIEKISKRLLAGERVSVLLDDDVYFEGDKLPDELLLINENEASNNSADIYIGATENIKCTIHLKPKKMIVGIGCRKGKSFDEIMYFIKNKMKENEVLKELLGPNLENVYELASIDLKKNEIGILELAGYLRVPFLTFKSDELLEVKGEFSESDFVKGVTGVSNVCERAAAKAAGDAMSDKVVAKAAAKAAGSTSLLVRKTAGDGVTLAVAKRECVRLTYVV